MGTTKKATASGRPAENKPATGDPLNIKDRLYQQIGRLLDDLEAADRNEIMTQPQRVSALIAVGRVLTIFAALRKGDYDYGNAGSKIREYAAAFGAKAHGVGSRAHSPRGSEPVDFDSSSDEYDA
jgi:hypothetical protein